MATLSPPSFAADDDSSGQWRHVHCTEQSSSASDTSEHEPADKGQETGKVREFRRVDKYWDTVAQVWETRASPPQPPKAKGIRIEPFTEFCFLVTRRFSPVKEDKWGASNGGWVEPNNGWGESNNGWGASAPPQVVRASPQVGWSHSVYYGPPESAINPQVTVVNRDQKEKWIMGDPVLEVYDQDLAAALRDVLRGVNDIDWNFTKPLAISPVLLLPWITEFQSRVDDELKKSGSHSTLGILLEYLRDEYATIISSADQMISTGEVTFPYIPWILKPGVTVYQAERFPRLYKVAGVSQVAGPGGFSLSLSLKYLEGGGDSYQTQRNSWKVISANIGHFSERCNIKELDYTPIALHPARSEIVKDLLIRGQKWANLDGIHYKQYGETAAHGFHTMRATRIVVDKGHHEVVRSQTSRKSKKGKRGGWEDWGDAYDGYDSEMSDEAQPRDNTLREDIPVLAFAPPFVYGFDLEEKQWERFEVDEIRDIEWNESAFRNLVIPLRHKALLESLVGAHGQSNFDDFIVGKGKGLVVNLFGPSGVGKTMTAEAMSEHLKRPLYVATASEIGTEPENMEESLKRIFNLAAAWGAIVLIDEADIYLEKRSHTDIARNGMVSTLLRLLEYHQGILFLTTNRITAFDEAFLSRIDINLRYAALTEESRAQVWEAFLAKVNLKVGQGLSGSELVMLAKRELNGRQIKNCVRTATALAISRSIPLSFKILSEVLDIVEEFNSGIGGE